MATIIDGKKTSEDIKKELRLKTEELKKRGIIPGLAVVLVGNNPASCIYVRNKQKDCDECGFYNEEYKLEEDYGEEKLLALIAQLNKKESIHGILVQLPLPAGYNEEKILDAISPEKDVDAFHPQNVGRIMIGNYKMLPCTPAGVMELLKRYGITLAGKECVVVGRSNIVGKPMAMLLLHANATVTIAHSRTRDLAEVTRRADILVSAVGKRDIITADMVKEGAVVIDVGMNRNDLGKLCGDVAYNEVSEKASYITPVPGGVGPMTRAMLMMNTYRAAEASVK